MFFKKQNIQQTLQFTALISLLLIGIGCSVLAAPDSDDAAPSETKTVYFVAGEAYAKASSSHDYQEGCELLADHLEQGVRNVETKVYTGGWPESPDVFKGADAIVMYSQGGDRHMLSQNPKDLDRLAEKGVGIVALHWAVEAMKGTMGNHFLDWLGGYFEPHWSVNPRWTAKIKELPEHPTTRGIKPFTLHDEWYFHMRFRENMSGVTPILQDLPPKKALIGRKWKPGQPSKKYRGNQDAWNAVVKKKQPQVLAWATQRDNGGRGFGITAGHYHRNWGHNQLRRLVLNAIAWAAHIPVPENGVPSDISTVEELEKYYPKSGVLDAEKVRRKLKRWNETD